MSIDPPGIAFGHPEHDTLVRPPGPTSTPPGTTPGDGGHGSSTIVAVVTFTTKGSTSKKFTVFVPSSTGSPGSLITSRGISIRIRPGSLVDSSFARS